MPSAVRWERSAGELHATMGFRLQNGESECLHDGAPTLTQRNQTRATEVCLWRARGLLVASALREMGAARLGSRDRGCVRHRLSSDVAAPSAECGHPRDAAERDAIRAGLLSHKGKATEKVRRRA